MALLLDTILKTIINKITKKMKKSTYLLITMVLLLSVFPTGIFASEKASVIIENPKEIPIEVQAMFNRLDEIKMMDKSKLNTIQKKELRKEIKTILKLLQKFKRKGFQVDNLLKDINVADIDIKTCNVYKNIREVVEKECDKAYVQNKEDCIERTYNKANIDQDELGSLLKIINC